MKLIRIIKSLFEEKPKFIDIPSNTFNNNEKIKDNNDRTTSRTSESNADIIISLLDMMLKTVETTFSSIKERLNEKEKIRNEISRLKKLKLSNSINTKILSAKLEQINNERDAYLKSESFKKWAKTLLKNDKNTILLERNDFEKVLDQYGYEWCCLPLYQKALPLSIIEDAERFNRDFNKYRGLFPSSQYVVYDKEQEIGRRRDERGYRILHFGVLPYSDHNIITVYHNYDDKTENITIDEIISPRLEYNQYNSSKISYYFNIIPLKDTFGIAYNKSKNDDVLILFKLLKFGRVLIISFNDDETDEQIKQKYQLITQSLKNH